MGSGNDISLVVQKVVQNISILTVKHKYNPCLLEKNSWIFQLRALCDNKSDFVL